MRKIDKTIKKRTPPKKQYNGRLCLDWGKLEELWLDSGLQPLSFLEQYELNIMSSYVRQYAGKWKQMLLKTKALELDEESTGKINLKYAQRAEEKNPFIDARPDEISMWHKFQKWRADQGQSDWVLADAMKTHLKIQLNKALRKHPDGSPLTELRSKELSMMASTLANLQRIQRLALGMSTDNHGVQEPPDPNVAKNTEKQPDFPTFVVEVNKDGKFERARPRQIA